jgi:hypothetical protein
LQLLDLKREGLTEASMLKGIIAVASLTMLCACASNSPQERTPAECTASNRIWHEFTQLIPSNLNDQQAREAIGLSLKGPDVPVRETSTKPGREWRYEYQDDDAIYASLTVRSHYLRVAIIIDAKEAKSIVCDSRNLDQSRFHIHRNVQIWKAVLDDNIRIALRQAAENHEDSSFKGVDERIATQTNYLNALFEWGILTKEEYEQIMQRVTDNQQL